MPNDLILFLSDLHHGAHTEDFDPVVSRRRQLEIPDRLDCEAPRKLVVALGGDLIEGVDIHPSQNAMVRYSAREQARDETDILTLLITKLRRKWPKAEIIVEEAYGNHGRTSHTAHPDNNWDLVIGDNLARIFQQDAHVRVRINYAVSRKFRMGGHTFLMQHRTKGNETHLQTNAIRGRVMRRLMAKKADVFLLGHFHTGEAFELDGKLRLVVGGSLKGHDGYGEELGIWTPPKLAVITVAPGELTTDNVRWLRW